MKIAIVGGGVAALQCALAARKTAPNAEIVIWSAEKVPPYRRPALSRLVAEEIPEAQFYLTDSAEYARNRIVLRLGCRAAKLECAAHRVVSQSGEVFVYDRLVLATGSRAFVPELPGVREFPPQTLRGYADCMALRARLDAGGRRAVVAGGGLLGLELADALCRKKLAVTVVEACPSLLSKQLSGEDSSLFLEIAAEKSGVEFLTGDAPSAFTADGVTLASGRKVAGDLVCAACGVRADVSLARSAGLACGAGIRVDAALRTSEADVFAAGDCAELDGRCSGMFAAAREMGSVAGMNAAGGAAEFAFAAPAPLFWRGLGVKIAAGKVFAL